MNSITKQAKKNIAMQVVKRINEGMTVKDACLDVGIPRSTFYALISREPDIVAEAHELIQMNSRMELFLVLQNQTTILERVIEDGLAKSTSPRDRLAILKAVHEMQARLEELVLSRVEDKSQTLAMLKGPELELGKSRYGSVSEN